MLAKPFMVITTHMYNQMIQENEKSENKKVLNNPDSEVIQSFLKDSKNFQKTEKRVISSN